MIVEDSNAEYEDQEISEKIFNMWHGDWSCGVIIKK